MGAEYVRFTQMRDKTNVECDCYLWKTHLLPCVCIFANLKQEKRELQLHDVHAFWRTLVLSDDDDVLETQDEPPSAEDAAHEDDTTAGKGPVSKDVSSLYKWVKEVIKRDRSVVRRITQLIKKELHPEKTHIPDPQISPPRRGRPSMGRSTRREPSAIEYSRRFAPRRQSFSATTSTEPNSQPSARRYSVSSDVRASAPSATTPNAFPWPNDVPTFIIPYIERWVDVLGDGNCGFRVLAHACYSGEDEWPRVRQLMRTEVENNYATYDAVYQLTGNVDAAIHRIGGHMYGPAPAIHWMSTPDDLYAAATIINCIFVGLSVAEQPEAHDVYEACSTIFPVRCTSGATGPRGIIAVAHVNSSHYVRVQLSEDSPLPPVHPTWFRVRHDTVVGWEVPYGSRIADWTRLRNELRGSSNMPPNVGTINVDDL